MMLSAVDLWVTGIYCLALIAIATWVSRGSSGRPKTTEDYFLAGRSLPWWAVGASLIAANISAEQIIGMSGSAYAIGLGIATYEWTAAIALIVMAKYFLPIFIDKKIYTMPQFLEQRFDHRIKTVLAIFWLSVYIFVNLTSVLYLGALAIQSITGISMSQGILFLAFFSLAYSLYGGLKAVALTDIIQVVLLIAGGIAVTVIALNQLGDGQGIAAGFMQLWRDTPAHFDMILDESHPGYMDLPGISVLVGGLWIAHFAYWGFNQYITQRALAAKNLREAQKGVMFASYLKLCIPFIVVLPGIAAVQLSPGLDKPDQAYPTMMALLPHGLLGLTFAALIAAIVSSLASMTNSVSTIFTIDLYRPLLRKSAEESEQLQTQHLVKVGRIASVLALLIAVVVAQPLLGKLDQAFQYIQEFTGFFTPGILFIFLSALFWKKATTLSALVAALVSLALSIALKLLAPDIPFIDRMGIVFLVSAVAAFAVVQLSGNRPHPKAVDTASIDFKTSAGFNLNVCVVLLILTAFYTVWW